MMKTRIIIGIITAIIVSSCGTFGESVKKNKLKYEEGTIIYDNSTNAIFIPKNLEEKDLVYLTKIKIGDSMEFKSNFSREHVDISFCNSGKFVEQDSINVRIEGVDSYPIGLVKVDFFRDQEFVSSYSPLGGYKKAFIQEATGFTVDVFGAKSDFFQLNRSELRDTLIIFFDYLRPSEIEKYTFIDFSILR